MTPNGHSEAACPLSGMNGAGALGWKIQAEAGIDRTSRQCMTFVI
jgi:hypothetical protein